MHNFISTNATLKASRSKFPLNHRVLSSYTHGYLYPCGDPIEVLPGDSFKCKISHLTRMSAPIFPIMDTIEQSYMAAFVPKRILFNKTKQFYGEAEDFGIATEINEPTMNAGYDLAVYAEDNNKDTLIGNAFGLVSNDNDRSPTDLINVLPIRAFMAVYNELFRNEVFCPKYLWDKDQIVLEEGDLAIRAGTSVDGYSELPKVSKDNDVFTTTLPWQQKGDPCGIENPDILSDGNLEFDLGGLGTKHDDVVIGGDDESLLCAIDTASQGDKVGYYKGLKVEGSTANLLFTINELKYAAAYQNYLTRLGHFGSRYAEAIKSFFGVQVPDLSANIPQFLGHFSTHINVDQVLQTTGHAAGSSSTLGQVGANSVTAKNGYLFNSSFSEPGYIVICTYFKHKRSYSQGVAPLYFKKKLLDYYNPAFAEIGDVPISKAGLYWDGRNQSTNFGFQEAWTADYRQISDVCRGMLNPAASGSLNFITLSDVYANEPILGQSFIEEDRNALSRCLTTGESGIDYICDTLIQMEATRVMPLHTNEGGRIGVL